VKTDGVPALPFMLCGLLPWNYFSGILQRGGGSLISDARLISKVYFPRLLIPLASTVAVLIDFGVTLAVLAISMACYHIAPTWRICFVPFFLLLTTLIATGVSLWLSALNVKYRDFMYAMPFLIQVWMYASPVVYAMSTIPARWRLIFTLNPASGFIEGFRWSLLGSAHTGLTVQMVALTTVLAFVAFVSGVFFFRRVERQFADFV
jgi:lipopolysaccharide transport system permease protein